MAKELLIRALHGNRTARVPWLPYACINSAFLIKENADDYLRSPELIARGVVETAKRYKADGIPLLFDLSVDAEAVGCKVNWWKDNVPSVAGHPCAGMETPRQLGLAPPAETSGRWPIIMEAARTAKPELDKLDCALVGLYCGPLTLASHLAGVRIFTDVYKNKAFAHEVLKFAGEVNAASAAKYAALGCEVIGIVDPVASQVKSATFKEFVTPYVKKGIDIIHEAGATSVFLICGDCTKVLEDVCTIGTHAFAIDEQLNLGFVRDMAVKHKVGFAGNLKLTMSLSLGLISTREDTLVSLAMGGTHGFTLAPG
jgi:MtaA/CmuA family methyltransferase